MRILVENSSYKLTNLGDHAMLQVGLDRLRALFPDAEMHVLTSAPQRLREIAPYAIPYYSTGRKAWCRQRLIPRWPQRMAFANRWNHSRSESMTRLKRPEFGKACIAPHRGRCPMQIRRKRANLSSFWNRSIW